MTGLIETFDVARRAGIFVYIMSTLEKARSYRSLLERYKSDYHILETNLRQYYKDCKNGSTMKKMQTGLVRKSSKVSLNKYVRVGAGLELLKFDFAPSAPSEGMLAPSWVSNTILTAIARPIVSNETGFDFDVGPRLKLILLQQILRRDSSYILPLIYTIGNLDETPKINNIRRTVMRPYAENLLRAFEYSLNMPGMPHDSAKAMYGRIPFIRRNIRLMKDGRVPRRGFLHLIDPRLNWLYDLDLVDTDRFCRDGAVVISGFWPFGDNDLVDFMKTTIREQDDLFDNFAKIQASRYQLKEDIKPNLEAVLDYALKPLEKRFDRLIPMSTVRLLVTSTSLCYGFHPKRSDIIGELKCRGYSIYRDYMAGEGYIERRNSSKK